MDLRQLRYFVALAEELHFTRAAQRLGMAQPPLSQQIRQLEAELDTKLFERGTRHVALTEAGKVFLTEARATLAQARRAELVARRAGRGEIGELRMGLFASAPLLPAFTRAVLAFRARLPDVHLTLRESPTLEQVDALRRGELDAGFLRCPSAEHIPVDIAAVELLREPLMAMMRSDHPLAAEGGPLQLSRLAEEKLIFFSAAVGTTLHAQFLGLCRAAGFAPQITQTARENSTLIGLVAAGLGIAVMPASLAQIQVAEVTHRPLADTGATTSIWLATPCQPTALARAFLACATG
ncbi:MULTISPECIES: LysR substrate-binding domain-containing protein [Roseomonadaceae]|uniref:LysR family transcriptional regulator n=1 Tax=Falsiroseomonas oleicola TaxID=2801474 RepID=A0ABS6H9M4_9PROT|nr:LysR substrate-binding domain-containing protein [Roseomonas oleicola]MBU8544196.1 LysR family transcriptional regulator [Roseomonas oleicola]